MPDLGHSWFAHSLAISFAKHLAGSRTIGDDRHSPRGNEPKRRIKMIVYLWQVTVESNYTKGYSTTRSYDVSARNFNGALAKVKKLVPKTYCPDWADVTGTLKKYEITSLVQGNTLDA